MKIANYISPRERKALLTVSLATLIFSIVGFVTYNVKEDLKRAEYYRQQDENKAQGKPVFAGPYCFPDRHPQTLLKMTALTGLTFLFLLFSKRYIFSTISTLGLFGFFVYWYFATQIELRYDELGRLQGIDRIFFRASDFDFSVFLLSIILVFWQFSILFRIFVQRKNVLP